MERTFHLSCVHLVTSISMGINKINFKFLYSQFGELPPGAECKIKMTYIMELPVERNMVIVKLTTPTTVPPRFTPLFKHCKLNKNLHSVIVIESHAIVPSLCWYFIFWLFVKITLMIQYDIHEEKHFVLISPPLSIIV